MNTSQPSSVTPMVCSNWADSCRSAGDRGPAVRQHLYMRLAQIDHRLDREQHARLQHGAFAGLAIMQDVRAVVEHLPQPVAAEITHDGTALALGIGLDRFADVPGGMARFDRCNTAGEGFMSDLYQPFGLARNITHSKHPAGIAVPAVKDQRYVDIDDFALFQRLGSWNAVADHVIDRHARRLGIAAVIQRRGDRVIVHGKLEIRSSSSPVLTPGRTSGTSISSALAASCPASRMAAKRLRHKV